MVKQKAIEYHSGLEDIAESSKMIIHLSIKFELFGGELLTVHVVNPCKPHPVMLVFIWHHGTKRLVCFLV